MSETIVLIGFMGCGKTYLGRYAAAALGMRFVDTDEAVEAYAGRTIAEIFDRSGEEQFRRLEALVLERCCRDGGRIVATGGGIVKNPHNIENIRKYNAKTVWLQASAEAVYARLEKDKSRPLLADVYAEERLERIRSLMREREALYREAADAVFCQEGIEADDMGERFVKWLRERMLTKA